jgi:protease secretion system membrane fusion protein
MADELNAGLKVDISFSGLNHVNLSAVEGEVLTVSADQLLDETNHQPYFLARVQLTQKGLATLAEHKITLQPGIPAEVLVKTGARTLLNYLTAPIRDRMEWAFIEK